MVNLTNIGGGEGGSVHQIALVRQFRRLGLDVNMIAPSRRKTTSLPDDIREICWLSPSVEGFGFPTSLDSFFQVPYVLWARWQKPFAHLYVRYNFFSILIAILGRILGMKVIVEHNSWGAGQRTSRRGSWLTSRLEMLSQVGIAQVSNYSRCVSSGLADLLASRGVSPRKLVTIGNGTDTRAFFPMDREAACRVLSLSPNLRRIGFLGILAPWQGCETAIQALAYINEKHSVELVIAGDGSEYGRLKMLAKEIGVAESVQFLGHISPQHANTLINCFDVALAPYASPRKAELWLSPIKIRDYAAAGRPIAASAVPGIVEYSNGDWLFTHEPDDPKQLAKLLIKMLSPDFNLEAAGQAARRYAEQHFDWSIVGTQVGSLLERE